MSKKVSGAHVLISALKIAGVRKIFGLSGNHIMSIYDAAIGSGIELLHVRHEAAAVHMADAWARMTGEPGVALVSGGQAHVNAVSALCTAVASESPVILLSGHAGLDELGLGAFQELRQAEIAEPLTKFSITVQSGADLAEDVARAIKTARSGRPGPVHVSLPSDLLEGEFQESSVNLPTADAFAPQPMPLSEGDARLVLASIAKARRPIVIAPPAMCTTAGKKLLAGLREAIGVPVASMESPRGVLDPSLGAFAGILAEADLIVLLGKQLDYTLRFGRPPFVDPHCRWVVIDPDPAMLARAETTQKGRLDGSFTADAQATVAALIGAAGNRATASRHESWFDKANTAFAFRPSDWKTIQKSQDAPCHPAFLCRLLQSLVERNGNAIFVSDGGEFGQWGQAIVQAPCRIINGIAGAIGPSIPFAIGAKAASPDALVLTVLGDGTFGFHMAEFETAVRHRLPFVAIVGNDSRWNAEYQLQLRSYGQERAVGCVLSSDTRYDLVASALGGHGEFVTKAKDLPAALERAIASGKPACINVVIQSEPAPKIAIS